jgi:hypothetical protein
MALNWTDEQKQEWLTEDNVKIIIADIVYHDGQDLQVGYFSNYSYITPFGTTFVDELGNTVSNISYIDNLINIPNIISKIDSDVNVGALEFLNAEGDYDDYVNYAWEGHPMHLYIGDPTWEKDDFIIILEAISTNISSPRPNIMALSIRDKKEVFNVKAQEELITETYVRTMYSDYFTTYGSQAFVANVTNLVSQSQSIEIKIAVNTSANDIAQLVHDHIVSFPEFNTNLNPTTNILRFQSSLNGTVEDAHDGNGSNPINDTGFGFTITQQGTAGQPEITQITTVADVGGNLNNTYFHIHSPYRNFYVWFNVDNGSTDPELIEESTVAFDPNLTGITFIPETVESTPVPICLGICFNIEPKLIDTYNHVYQIHEGPIQQITEIRANGIPLNKDPLLGTVQYEENLLLGCFRLLVHQNNTQITCDAIGTTTRGTGYNAGFNIVLNSAAHLVEWLALEKTSLTSDDICPLSFSDTAFTNTSPLGLYIKDESEIASLITDIMSSVGGFARFDRVCTLQIFRLEDPKGKTPDLYIVDDDVIEKGVSLGVGESPKSSISLGFKRNWTVQDKGSLAGIITDESQDFLTELDLFTNEYSKVTASNAGIKTQFPLAVDTDLIPTLLANKSDATTEVSRRISLRSKKRFVYKVSTIAAPFTINIGDVVNLKHSRFGFAFGKECLVIGMEEQPTKQRVTLEVWL